MPHERVSLGLDDDITLQGESIRGQLTKPFLAENITIGYPNLWKAHLQEQDYTVKMGLASIAY